MPRVKTPSTCARAICGATFYRWAGQVDAQFCSRQCWLKEHNTPERNAAVARATSKQRGDTQRGRGEGKKTYCKRDGRHEHRIVAETILGRTLRPEEVVHHEDENKRNNDPTNLIIFPNQAEHARYHMKKRYA
jgi:hypothetical protein